MMTIETRKRVLDWWVNSIQSDQRYDEMDTQSRYNCCNLLAGFLQACERFDLMSHDEAQNLFAELVG